MDVNVFHLRLTVPQVVDAGSTSKNHFLRQRMFGFGFQGDEHEGANDCVSDNKSTHSNLIISMQLSLFLSLSLSLSLSLFRVADKNIGILESN